MKKIFLLFITMLSLNMFSQNTIEEGVLTMKMTMSSENADINAQLAMMGEMVMTTYFKGNKSRSEMKNPMAGTTTTIVDNDSKTTLVLMDNPMMGKKYSENEIKISEEDLSNLKVTETGDSKTIAGYTCKGYIVSGKKGDVNVEMTMYTTEEIKATTQNNVTFGNKMKGFPMHLITNVTQGGFPMKITVEVTQVKGEKVDNNKFDMTIPKGYSKIEKPKPATID